MARNINVRVDTSSTDQWMSSTDLMSGLMLVFMLIALAFMINASQETEEVKEQKEVITKQKNKMEKQKKEVERQKNIIEKQRDQIKSQKDNVVNIAKKWVIAKDKIYEALLNEFRDDLPKWRAEIDKEELIVRFREPTVLFKKGRSSLSRKFKEILNDFFPRYVKILKGFEETISEVRIEGHTSSEWNHHVSEQDAFFRNMILSHNRSREVLIYSLKQSIEKSNYKWITSIIVASGMSSSRPIINNGVEDKTESRRVEFRVRTNAEEKLSEIVAT